MNEYIIAMIIAKTSFLLVNGPKVRSAAISKTYKIPNSIRWASSNVPPIKRNNLISIPSNTYSTDDGLKLAD
ncbi:hypothetical protein [Bacillus sp. PS06]|uniref:hypothetical protein n=1 Tax=Bacillus sp. PS06 TaxID=2764176 RepID=UPI0021E606A6|nr:hypothetical protein [Bacillus sp. PS06]